jgi:hypothetical protein
MATNAGMKELQKVISSKQQLTGGAEEYLRRFDALHGGTPDKGDIIGQAPEGFGPVFNWDRDTFEEVELSLFINAADPLGVMITGAKAEDRITITSASGLASFTQADGSLAPSFAGFVFALSGGVAVHKGADKESTGKIVDAATKFAEQLFKDDDVNKLRRDAFGREPESGNHAKREGGIVVCLPRANGPYYSGSDKKFNLKSNDPRTDSQKPAHVRFGFFLVRGDENHMSRRVGADGEIYVLGWDHRFDDNAGTYHVRLRLERGEETIVE